MGVVAPIGTGKAQVARARDADPWAELASTKQTIAARVLRKFGIA